MTRSDLVIMAEAGGGILLQFLMWVAQKPRTYTDTMDAWRTSCPRLSVWEDALADGLMEINGQRAAQHGAAEVRLTRRGQALLPE